MADPIQGVSGSNAANIAPASGATANQQTGSAPAAATGAAPAADTANVAQVKTLLDMISQVAATIPTVDPGRVAQLRQAIADGSYQIDPQSTAKQLAQIESFLSGPSGG